MNGDVGNTLQVIVSYTDGGGTLESVDSNDAGPVTAALEALFSNSGETRNFNSDLPGDFIATMQLYNAKNGNDIVTLPADQDAEDDWGYYSGASTYKVFGAGDYDTGGVLFTAGRGVDQMTGGFKGDVFYSNTNDGSDNFNGSGGFDFISYENEAGSVNVDLSKADNQATGSGWHSHHTKPH